LILREPTSESIVEQAIDSARWHVALALVLSIALGLGVSWLVTSDWLTSLLRGLGVTARSSRASVWSDVFHTVDGYVSIEFGDGRRLRGWPQHFSDTPEEASVFLARAAWILDDGTAIEIAGPGILVTKNYVIQTIMFLDPVPKGP
jgi:hypothetical protein